MVIDADAIPRVAVEWLGARRIVRSLFPPVDLFDDISEPEDWPLLVSAEQKTNPRLMENVGELGLVPTTRRATGPGSSYLMAPFAHVSRDRPSRFSDGSFGVLYAGKTFEVALLETVHHHARFMARTTEPPGWQSQFREIMLDARGTLHDLRVSSEAYRDALDPDDYAVSQSLALRLKAQTSDGIAYPSVRCPGGECAALFFPDLASNLVQGRHLDYHWNGETVDYWRDAVTGAVMRIIN